METKKIELDTNVQFLKGVGPAKYALLNKVGINNVKDLLEYYPRSYEDRTKILKISEFVKGDTILFIGRVNDFVKVQRIRKNLVIYTTFVSDDTGECKLTFFNQTYIRERLKEGIEYLFYGKVDEDRGMLIVENPLIYNLNDIDKIQGIYPIYTLTAGITQNYIFKIISELYEKKPYINDIFNDNFKKKYDLCEINYAMQNVHFPKDFNMVNSARNRIIFEELFLLQLALLTLKNNTLSEKKVNIFKDVDINPFLELLPFNLTNAQQKVVEEIRKDLTGENIMNRLVQR